MHPFSIISGEPTPEATTPLQGKTKRSTNWQCASVILTGLFAVLIVVVVVVQNVESVRTQERQTAIEAPNKKGGAGWPVESDQAADMLRCGQTWDGEVAAGTIRNFRFRAPVAASATFDTCGSLFDTVLAVRSGTTQVWTCDNCGPCGTRAAGTLAIPTVLRSGTVYTIRLSGATAAQTGRARLRIDCAGIPVTCGTTPRATTTALNRAFYTITVPANAQTVTFDTCRAGFDTRMWVYRGANPGRSQIWECDDCGACDFRETIEFNVGTTGSGGVPPLTPGQQYSVAVGGYESEAGSMVLNVRCQTRGTTTARPTSAPATPRPSAAPSRPQPTSVPSTSSPATPRPTGAPVTTTTSRCGPRIRRDWMEISQAERDLYVNGFLQLYRNRKIATFTRTHLNNEQWAHSVNMFNPWHRYFIWELEEQIRNLGGAYSCFTLPYWDWTRNSGNERGNPMFQHGLGGDGRGQCLQTGAFRQGQYQITAGGCLIRQFDGAGLPFPTTQATMNNMMSQTDYSRYRQTVEFGGHGGAHNFLGGFEGIIATMESPDDPFFYLLHGFVDFLWALWQDCHQYDTVAPSAINSNLIYPMNEIDTTMEYASGQDSLVNAAWARVTASNRITPRMMHNIRGGFLQYQYHTTITSRSGFDFSRCTFGSWIIRPTVSEASLILSGRDAAEHVAIELDKKTKEMAAEWMEVGKMVAAEGDGSYGRRKKWRKKRFWKGKGKKLWDDMTARQRDNMLAQLACERSKYLEHDNGGPEPCEFDPDAVEKCGEAPAHGRDKFTISLGELLRKRGVRNNKCLKRLRRSYFKWAKAMGPSALRGLCNGLFDKRLSCNYGDHDSGESA